MSITAFFVDALGSALQLGIATPDDVIRHVTPDVLAAHLPRPLWAKLLAACLTAPRTDARLVVDTLGVPALCEHVPGAIVWACLAEVGQRSLGKSIVAPPPAAVVTAPAPMPTPAPMPALERRVSPTAAPITETAMPAPAPSMSRVPTQVTSSVPPPSRSPDDAAPLAPPPIGARPPVTRPPEPARPGEPMRPPTSPGNGVRVTGAGASTRRPQAQATPLPGTRPVPRSAPPSPNRPPTNTDFDVETDVGAAEWKKRPAPVSVDDEQLVDWAQSDETITGGVNDRKR